MVLVLLVQLDVFRGEGTCILMDNSRDHGLNRRGAGLSPGTSGTHVTHPISARTTKYEFWSVKKA